MITGFLMFKFDGSIISHHYLADNSQSLSSHKDTTFFIVSKICHNFICTLKDKDLLLQCIASVLRPYLPGDVRHEIIKQPA